MSYLIPLKQASKVYDTPDRRLEMDSETLVLEIPPRLILEFDNGDLEVLCIRPNFRKRFRPEPSYQLRVRLDATYLGWHRRSRKMIESPRSDQGAVLHQTSLKKLRQFQVGTKVLAQIDGSWQVVLIEPHVDPKAIREARAKDEKRLRLKEAKKEKQRAAKPSLFARLLDSFLD